jgi:hypothetical protein
MFDLLDTVLPSEGRYCVFGNGKYPDQRFVNTKEELNDIAKEFVEKKICTFFGCAKYGPADNRTHENATYFKSLWMDIDCGPTKGVPDKKGKVQGYLSQSIGLLELSKFCKTVGLPKPIIVNSGNGIHAYWLLENTVERRVWEPMSHRLRDLCKEHGLIVDPSVFEASRILRIPGTFNFKNKAEPLVVKVLSDRTRHMTCSEVRQILGVTESKNELPDFLPRKMSPMMEAILSNKVKRFKTIMLRSVKGDGCNQLLHCYNNQTTLEEPLWRSALSITAFCVDKDKASHMMSNKYEGYDPDEVDRKIHSIIKKGGPHTCGQFEKLNPNGCDGCPHKGIIKSPIVLGTEIEEATEADNKVEVKVEEEIKEIKIPEYPFPYFRGKNGGIYRRPNSEEETEPELVYEHDFYVVKRMHDKEQGEVILFKLHLPHDGVREFTIPASSISAKDELRRCLSQRGVMVQHKSYDSLAAFVITFIKNLQFQKKAEIMRTQFGWVEGDSKFVMGDKEITKDGTFYSPPSSVTESIAEKIHPKGTLENWKKVFNMYAKLGLEPNAFAALTAFGSPLFKFTGLQGAIINVIHESAGSGKSTALYMCNSVYGDPVKLTSTFRDTFNAKMIKLGVMNHLPNTVDEITNLSGKEFSDYAYSISGGIGKDRVEGASNKLRVNNTSWQNLTLCSANASFHEKLSAVKTAADGESVRLLEYRIEPSTIISVAEGKQVFDHDLRENYGHAGEIYIQWLVNNLEYAQDTIKKVQARIDKEVQFTSRERFWSGTCACIIAGGLIAKNLGLHDYDMKAIYEWMKKMLSEMRIEVKAPQSTPVAILGEFINAHINNALVVNGNADARTNMVPLPLLEPKNELLIRYEPDTKELYVAAKQFKDFCVRHQTNYKTTIKNLEGLNVYKETLNKRMSKGMKVVSPPVRAIKFDTSTAEFLHLDVLVNHNENRDNTV